MAVSHNQQPSANFEKLHTFARIINVQQLTAWLPVLACVIDIITAFIPELLLWKLRIKRKTKFVLNIIFALGIVTSALSIGRAATTNNHIWRGDITCTYSKQPRSG